MWTSLEDHYSACHSMSLETSLETSLDKLLNIWGHRHPIHLSTISCNPLFSILFFTLTSESLTNAYYNQDTMSVALPTLILYQLSFQGYEFQARETGSGWFRHRKRLLKVYYEVDETSEMMEKTGYVPSRQEQPTKSYDRTDLGRNCCYCPCNFIGLNTGLFHECCSHPCHRKLNHQVLFSTFQPAP